MGLILGSYSPPASASYVSPYDDMTQRYATPDGAGLQDGTSLANAWALTDVFANSGSNRPSPGVCVNFAAGQYDFGDDIGNGAGSGYNVNNDATGPHPTQAIVCRPTPGTATLGVIFDTNGIGPLLMNGLDYWKFDGEDSLILVTGGALWVGSSGGFIGTSDGLEFYNLDMEGDTQGTDNASIIRVGENVVGTKFRNVRVQWTTTTANANQACIQFYRLRDLVMENITLTGAPTSFYYKHGPEHAGAAQASWNTRYRRMITQAESRDWVDHSSYMQARDIIVHGAYADAGGRTGSENCTYNHITSSGQMFWPNDAQGDDPGQSAQNNIWRNCVVDSLRWAGVAPNTATPTPDPDTNWMLFENDYLINGTSYNLASRQSSGYDDDSYQETITFAGSDETDPADWALASGNGIGADPIGKDLGADVSKVGFFSDATIPKPAIEEEFYLSALNQKSDTAWYDETTFTQGTHPRHGFGCYEYAWPINTEGAPDGDAIRHKFTPTDEVTLYFQFWTDANFGMTGSAQDWLHLIHFKSTTSTDFEAPSSGMTLYFEPYQPTVGASQPGYFFVDVRRQDLTFAPGAYRNSTADNQATDSDINVFDGNVHDVRLYMKANTIGQADGLLTVEIDNIPTIAMTDFQPFTSTAQFDQVFIAPYMHLDNNNPAAQSLYMGDFKLFTKDW